MVKEWRPVRERAQRESDEGKTPEQGSESSYLAQGAGGRYISGGRCAR